MRTSSLGTYIGSVFIKTVIILLLFIITPSIVFSDVNGSKKTDPGKVPENSNIVSEKAEERITAPEEPVVLSDKKTYTRDVTWSFSENDSFAKAREDALNKAKRDLLQELGTMVISIFQKDEKFSESGGKSEFKQKAEQRLKSITLGVVTAKINSETFSGFSYQANLAMTVNVNDLKHNLEQLRNELKCQLKTGCGKKPEKEDEEDLLLDSVSLTAPRPSYGEGISLPEPTKVSND